MCLSGDDDFDFTCLLHTYIRVPDVTKVTVSNLKGLQYVDKVGLLLPVITIRNHWRDSLISWNASFVCLFQVKGGETSSETRELVMVEQNVDRLVTQNDCDEIQFLSILLVQA